MKARGMAKPAREPSAGRMQLQRNETGSLSSRVYNKIRDGLIDGNFAPGQRLLMQEIAEQLGTSITPVREASMRLVSEQALELRSGRFVCVPDITRDRLVQIRLIRMALEGLAAAIAAERATEEDIARLAQTHDLFIDAANAGELERARTGNRAFHFGIYRLSGMDMLINQIENLWVSMGPVLNLYYNGLSQSYLGDEAHRQLLRALREKAPGAARNAIEKDIAQGGDVLLKHLFEAK